MRERQRQAAIALGIALIALVMIGETVMAHRRLPNPLSPWVWAVLGSVAGLALARWAWLTWQDRRDQRGDPPPR